MALRCQSTVLMLADNSGVDTESSPPKKKGILPSFFGSKKVERKELWIKRKLILTDESVRYFRPTNLKFDFNDPTPYKLQNASDKLLTRVSYWCSSLFNFHDSNKIGLNSKKIEMVVTGYHRC